MSIRNRIFYTSMQKVNYFALAGVHPQTPVRCFGTSLLLLFWHLIAPSARDAHNALHISQFFKKNCFHHRFKQGQVCLSACSHLTSVPNEEHSSDSGYQHKSFWQRKSRSWMPNRKIRRRWPVSSPFSSRKFEQSLKQLKLACIAYNFFFPVLWTILLNLF